MSFIISKLGGFPFLEKTWHWLTLQTVSCFTMWSCTKIYSTLRVIWIFFHGRYREWRAWQRICLVEFKMIQIKTKENANFDLDLISEDIPQRQENFEQSIEHPDFVDNQLVDWRFYNCKHLSDLIEDGNVYIVTIWRSDHKKNQQQRVNNGVSRGQASFGNN